jgi:hypothetical protein
MKNELQRMYHADLYLTCKLDKPVNPPMKIIKKNQEQNNIGALVIDLFHKVEIT